MDLKLVDTTSNATFTSAGTGAGIVDSGTPRLAVTPPSSPSSTGARTSRSIRRLHASARHGAHANTAGAAADAADRHPGGGGDGSGSGGHHPETPPSPRRARGRGIVDSGTPRLAVTPPSSPSSTGARTSRSIRRPSASARHGAHANTAGAAADAGVIDILEAGAMDLKLVDTTSNATFTSAGTGRGSSIPARHDWR